MKIVEAKLRYAKISARKVRDLARFLRGKFVPDASAMMKCIRRKSAKLLANLLDSATANAENNGNLSADRLVVDTVIVDEGPVYKRFIPAARGSAHPIKKRMSHIRLVLKEIEKGKVG
ncbi:MAG: 50S ribosomal protein L22 [Puniceicoccales bacterium]|jgi:large subunit ribosomal protein L22|nr:50S ribosomal protein L22 [Puniceicoccales bacterium]